MTKLEELYVYKTKPEIIVKEIRSLISDFYDEIREMILHDMDAGVTMMLSEKGYTRADSKLITSVIPYQKLPKIKERVQEIDPMAFMIVAKIEEVGGQGFTIERQGKAADVI